MTQEKRVALVTGASGGIGGAIARTLKARGAKLALSGTRAEALQALADELGGAEILPCRLDVADEVEALVPALDQSRQGLADAQAALAALPEVRPLPGPAAPVPLPGAPATEPFRVVLPPAERLGVWWAWSFVPRALTLVWWGRQQTDGA